MAAVELDPLFVKALRLLHSKSKDSTEQLKQLLDDALHHHTPSTIYGQDSRDPLSSIKISVNYGTKKSSPKHVVDGALATKKSLVIKDEEVKRKETEKRSFDKLLKQDVAEQSQEPKKSRMSSPKTIVIRSPSPVVIKEEDLTSDENTSATDIALEMGLACVVCRSFDVTSGNTLVECQDCHSLYHQECHKPPITDQDVNDPRLVWYCAKCTKNMKKMASKSQKSVKPVTTSTSKDSIIPNKTVKQEPAAAPPPSTHIFKRVEPKVTTSSATTSTSSTNKPIGLAGLAASLSGKSHSTLKPPQPSGGKPLTAMKSLIAASCNVKATSQTSSVNPKSSSFSNLLLPSKSSSQGSSSSNVSQTSGASGGGTSSSSFLANKSSSSTTLVTTVSSSKAASSSSAGGNGATTASSSLSNKSASSSSLMSADKRLQIMKKKAAAKMQEKRRLSSK